MTIRRLKNSELKLQKLEEEEAKREDQPGVFELFAPPEETPDVDAPLARDPSE